MGILEAISYPHAHSPRHLEMVAFESQKAQEILLISDEKGLFSVTKIRNKTFETSLFTNWVEQWRNHYNNNKHKEI